MGCSSNKSNNVSSPDRSQNQPSEFYFACRNGDVQTVEYLLPKLTIDDLNRIEPNGSTALHAASHYGYPKIVQLLLKHGCSTNLRNKFGQTPMDEAMNEEIHRLLVEQQTASELEDNSPPKSDRLEFYLNLNNEDKYKLATRIAKVRLMTYRTHKYQIEGINNTTQLERIFKKHVSNGDPEAEEAMIVLEKFLGTRNTDHLVELYLMETFVYRPPIIDDTFLIEMYVNLIKFNTKPFQGILYGGTRMSNEHFEAYRWALQNPTSLLETRRVLGTSPVRQIAEVFAEHGYDKNETKGISILFEYSFHRPCYTVMNLEKRKNHLRSLHYFEMEQEAMVLPGTFFEVATISEDKKNFMHVRMINIPVELETLMSEINALH